MEKQNMTWGMFHTLKNHLEVTLKGKITSLTRREAQVIQDVKQGDFWGLRNTVSLQLRWEDGLNLINYSHRLVVGRV